MDRMTNFSKLYILSENNFLSNATNLHEKATDKNNYLQEKNDPDSE